MLPLNQITPNAIASAFRFPYGESSLLIDRTYGGAALNDASQGREAQLWTIAYDGLNVSVFPESGVVQQTVPIAGVMACSLAFDANMNTAIAWIDGSGAHLRHFDSHTLQYSVLDIPGANSCKARTDDTRAFNAALSDVIFAYTLNGVLYYRVERDNYAIEYTVGVCGPLTLHRMGMSVGQRFQFEVN